MRIVVAEDKQDEGQELARLLRSLGHEVITALDGHDAVKACTEHQPEVAFIDLLLPGMNGFDVARRLIGRPHAPRLAAISGLHNRAAEQVARRVGFSAFLRKPYTIDDLQALLAPFLGSNPANQQRGGV
jgi:CheY-like chemotaxis protein